MNTESQFKPFTILVTGTEDTYTREAEKVLERSAKFLVRSVDPSALEGHEKASSIDAIVVGFKTLETIELDLLNTITAFLSGVPIVVVSDQLEVGKVRELIKLHVQDWLTVPIEPASLVKAIDNCVRSAKTNRNKVHAVVSGQAGAGATVVAASMADLLATDFVKRESVALFDLDFSTGNSGYILNMINRFDLKSVLSHPERIDLEFTNLIGETHRRGFHIFSFKRPELLSHQNGSELVLRMLDAVNVQNEHTVLDIPYYQTEWRDEVLGAVNTCTIVTELNLPALRQTLDTYKEIRAIRGPSFKIRIVINKKKSRLFGGGLSSKDIKDLFGDTPIWNLPYNDRLIEESLNRGTLPDELAPRSKFTRALKKYMKVLLEEEEKGG